VTAHPVAEDEQLGVADLTDQDGVFVELAMAANVRAMGEEHRDD
jgi:ABC-type lipopolysaccharide export system ATPase subunit